MGLMAPCHFCQGVIVFCLVFSDSNAASLGSSPEMETYSNGWRRMMVSSRSGPVEIMSTGTPQISSSRLR